MEEDDQRRKQAREKILERYYKVYHGDRQAFKRYHMKWNEMQEEDVEKMFKRWGI